MNFVEFTSFYSIIRVNRYYLAMNKGKKRTIRLYKANLQVAQAFHPLLGIVEVVLRNRLNEVLIAYFRDSKWIITEKTGFMSDPSLTYYEKWSGKRIINDFLKKEVMKVEGNIGKAQKTITSHAIIAELTFGFWTKLFETHHYKLLKGQPIKIFTNLSKGIGRKEVSEELEKIRRFRNRINHNEPICFVGNRVDFTETMEVYHSIMNILNWIDPELVKFTVEIDKVKETIHRATKI